VITFYPQIKYLHILAVLCSGFLFLLRGALVQSGKPTWAMLAPVRYLSYSIDTALLTLALMLLTILPHAVFANGWLITKMVLLVIYIVLGSFALKRGRTAKARLVCYLMALAAFGMMLSVALSHHPLGVLRRVFE
jgi:uncharacterized membrane protein SirB2